jgi:hypothetical protein
MSCRRSGNQLPGAPVLLWLCSSVPDWIPIKPSFLGPSPPSQAFLGPSAARSSLRSRRDPGRPDRVFLPGRDPSGPGRPPWARARLHRRVFGPARDRGGPVPSCLGATQLCGRTFGPVRDRRRPGPPFLPWRDPGGRSSLRSRARRRRPGPASLGATPAARQAFSRSGPAPAHPDTAPHAGRVGMLNEG